ncbi:hypothetical protein R1sor_021695 [Riccia sorocarpa]|uniref:Uncharacterized protein n=1 Tax=Riccia sorocarpa TaxID=122646 RepID=A0ABD3GNJ0_9MARC
MARLEVQLVLLVAAIAVAFITPALAARTGVIRQPIEKHRNVHPFFRGRGWTGVLCVAEVSDYLEKHEGRHDCAYDHPNGFRAVGVGYNLDDDVETRKSELSATFADYEKVYKGDKCLNNLQISGLLLLDSKRALDRASESVKPLNDFCCSVQAVFADIQHASGAAKDFPERDLRKVIEKAALQEYKGAARELEKTQFCSTSENKNRCDDHYDRFEQGC